MAISAKPAGQLRGAWGDGGGVGWGAEGLCGLWRVQWGTTPSGYSAAVFHEQTCAEQLDEHASR